jgi:predicted signal transduction protein with EAL and GGDEF domain
MNATVGRLKAMFEEEAARLEAVRQEANCDALTGLANRDYFMTQLRMALDDDESPGGSLLLIRVHDLIGINRRMGRAATDDLLRRVGKCMSALLTAHGEGVAARLNGADFALLLLGQAGAWTAADALLDTIKHETQSFVADGPAAHIAYADFPRGLALGTLMTQLDAALAAAEAEGTGALREATLDTDRNAPKSAQEWAGLLQKSVQNGWIKLGAFAVIENGGALLHRECPLRMKFEADSEWLPAGRFLPMAERLNLTHTLDLAAVELGLIELENDRQLIGLAINLSATSIALPEFRSALAATVRKHPNVAKRLWLEVAETGALRHFDEFRQLCHELKNLQCRIGIEHFGRQFSEVGKLHDLGLDYLKVDASFIRGVHDNLGNQAFLKGLSQIAHGIGMLVIAEGVADDAELQALAGVGFDGATGPGIK